MKSNSLVILQSQHAPWWSWIMSDRAC